MASTYEEIKDKDENIIIKRVDENGTIWWIPNNSANSDYQRYLRWLENPEADEAQSL